MTTAELKIKLIEKISKSDNVEMLEGISHLINIEEDSEIYVLNEDQERALNEADQNISEGKVYSHEEAHKIAKQWQKE